MSRGQVTTFKDLAKQLNKVGWDRARQTRHQVWRCPCGDHQVVLPTSTSDYRAIKNKVAQLRKMNCATTRDVL